MHTPVLLKEVLEVFNPQSGQIYIDATINGGGHGKAILERLGAKGRIVGIDWDCGLIEKLKQSQINNLTLTCDNYAHIKSIARKYNLGEVSGIIFDLGFSSYHPEESKRGFSFLRDEPLDMRYNINFNELTAEKIINTWPREAIEDILSRYGEERFARRIAAAIERERNQKNIFTTGELCRIIKESVPTRYFNGRIHPATKTFQALRIAVNNELENLEQALQDSSEILAKKGKIAVISFHSLEDRIVKRFFRIREKERVLYTLTPKPIRPTPEEILNNHRARSAKLRVAEKL